jgi:hypothetical protein
MNYQNTFAAMCHSRRKPIDLKKVTACMNPDKSIRRAGCVATWGREMFSRLENWESIHGTRKQKEIHIETKTTG